MNAIHARLRRASASSGLYNSPRCSQGLQLWLRGSPRLRAKMCGRCRDVCAIPWCAHGLVRPIAKLTTHTRHERPLNVRTSATDSWIDAWWLGCKLSCPKRRQKAIRGSKGMILHRCDATEHNRCLILLTIIRGHRRCAWREC